MTTVRPALDEALRHTIALRTEALFRSSGAFREGHFLLKSGRHGDAYVEKFQVLQDPAATSELCGFFAVHGRGLDGEPLVDLCAGPTTGGVILAFETARQLGRPEHLRRGGPRRRRAGPARVPARVPRSSRASASSSSTTSSRPAARCWRCCPRSRRWAARSSNASCWSTGAAGKTTLTSPTTGRVYPLRSLWQLDLPTYEPGPATCPRCADGTPLYAPGSTGTGTIGTGAAAS